MQERLSIERRVALLVSSVERSARFLNSLGIETGEPEVFESEGTKEVYVGSYASHRGLLLLLESIADGPYKRALLKRGPSLHHLAIDVLDTKAAVSRAVAAGWKLHTISSQTLAHKTAWLYLEGIPTLIEIHQKSELSPLPLRISGVELPLQKIEHMRLFEALGLADIVTPAAELSLTLDGQKLPICEILRPEPTP